MRRLFSSSPRDPRYHMLSLLSSKFSQGSARRSHEPRAALFLNRFTRTLAIMYATTALANVLGVTPDEVKGKSFYECIQENCLADAIRCLESAKANDSIAYMRFWFRDPRQDDQMDDRMSDGMSSEEDEDGGVFLDGHMHDNTTDGVNGNNVSHHSLSASSGNGTELGQDSAEAIFGDPVASVSSSSSAPNSAGADGATFPDPRRKGEQTTAAASLEEKRIEVEAVVSCSSDGLVVVLRRARPIAANASYAAPSPVYANGLFASPWAATPIMPAPQQSQRTFYGALLPDILTAQHHPQTVEGASGPPMEEFMNSIREVAVFAWSLTGINGSLAQYGRGRPTGESQPPGGLPVWDPLPKRTPFKTGSGERLYGTFNFGHDNGMGGGRRDEYRFTPNFMRGLADVGMQPDGGFTSRRTYDDGAEESDPRRWKNDENREDFFSRGRTDGDVNFHFDFQPRNGSSRPEMPMDRVSDFQRGINGHAPDYPTPSTLDGVPPGQWRPPLGPSSSSGFGANNPASTSIAPSYMQTGQERGLGGQFRWI